MENALPLLMAFGGMGKQNGLFQNTELLQLMYAFMPGEGGRTLAAIGAAAEAMRRPVIQKELDINEMLQLMEHHVSKSTLMMVRLFSAFKNMGDFNLENPEDMARLLNAVLPPEMARNMPDINTMMQMMNVMKDMDWDNTSAEGEPEAGETAETGAAYTSESEVSESQAEKPQQTEKAKPILKAPVAGGRTEPEKEPIVFRAMTQQQKRQFQRIMAARKQAAAR